MLNIPDSVDPRLVNLPVGGYLPQSLVDFPGCIAAVVFTQGCNFRCSYCHNPDLVEAAGMKEQPQMGFLEVVSELRRQASFLDGVVVTGGEPLIHSALPLALRVFKQFGLRVKLDTNGSAPDVLEQLIAGRLVDAVAIDIKAPLRSDRYTQVAGIYCCSHMLDSIRRSIALLGSADIETTFRSTPLKGIHHLEDILEMVQDVGRPLVLQRFRTGSTLKPVTATSFSRQELLDFAELASCTVSG
ncbi:MAG: anaerobic ribonucleoside-triphosphate reductase activating protein [Chlorobiaceae bacterium]|nr:anaerobic ribonucleoside-triphosphate reductase activating protein [Chlorobiaceae bacterium]